MDSLLTRQLTFNQHKIQLHYRDDSDQSVIDEVFIDRLYRRVEAIVPELTEPIIDVGAHIGIFSLYAGILNSSAIIYALEPHPENFVLLKQNISQNYQLNIIPKKLALHWEDTPAIPLYLSQNTHNHSTAIKIDKFEITVPAKTLEKFLVEEKITKIGLLKMDVEGAEFPLLTALEDKTWSKIKYLIVEYHEDRHHRREQLEELIRTHGFSVEHFPSPFDHKFGLYFCRNKKF